MCPKGAWNDHEIGCRLLERIVDHAGRDHKSQMAKHSAEQNHPSVSDVDFEIIHKTNNNSIYKRKIAEAILIKKHKPTLNIQEKSIPLKLFN